MRVEVQREGEGRVRVGRGEVAGMNSETGVLSLLLLLLLMCAFTGGDQGLLTGRRKGRTWQTELFWLSWATAVPTCGGIHSARWLLRGEDLSLTGPFPPWLSPYSPLFLLFHHQALLCL